MQRREDMNKYNTNAGGVPSERVEGEFSKTAGATAKTIVGMVMRLIKTVFFIGAITGLIVFISVASFVYSLRDSAPPDLSGMDLDFTSYIKVENPETGEFEDYLALVATENRIWAYMEDLNGYVMDAMVAIEDKRFYEHHGVDWYTTMGAVYKLASASGNSGGGSTITQQLIKNLTDQDQVSIIRKITEIFKALNLEKNYEKEEILLWYLNVVNFGGRANGVQAAAHRYFGKDIKDCDLAETAAIVGITQYPYQYDPYNDKAANKGRQKIVLDEMYDQNYITKAEYDEALAKAENMVFVGESYYAEEEDAALVADDWNWFTETMIADVTRDLAKLDGLSTDVASRNLYKNGYNIYSAMNKSLQEGVEALFQNSENQPADPEIQYGIYYMDYDGKTLAIVGSRELKTSRLVTNFATNTYRQTGSAIKPISVYAPALEAGDITWGTVLKDQPIKDFYNDGDGPNNFSRSYRKFMNVDKAIEMSQNAPAAQLLDILGIDNSYNFLADKLHLSRLDPLRDKSRAPLSLGGFTYGASVQEMTAAFQIFGNGGVYNEPYTYYYVTDHDGNVILDNRNRTGEQVLKPENAAVMNELLQNVVYGSEATAYQVRMDGVNNIFGKTGTAEQTKDLWFVGGTSFGVAGIWHGYADRPVTLEDSTTAKTMWRTLMSYVNNNFQLGDSGYKISENIVEKRFCRSSGYIAGEHCFDTDYGWYANIEGGIPRVCDGGADHIANGAESGLNTPSPSPSPTESPTPEPEETPEPTETPAPMETVAPTEPPITPEPLEPTEPPITPEPEATITPEAPPATEGG